MFRGLLVASSEDSATLSAALLGDHLAGRFAFDAATLGDRTLSQLVLNFNFSSGSFSGAINAGIQQTQGGSTSSSSSLQYVPLACWGGAGFSQAGCE
jgi:hypothetical protein